MNTIRTHEEMLADNELTQFEEHMGRAMFISHQWLLLPNWHMLASCRQPGEVDGQASSLFNVSTNTAPIVLPCLLYALGFACKHPEDV